MSAYLFSDTVPLSGMEFASPIATGSRGFKISSLQSSSTVSVMCKEINGSMASLKSIPSFWCRQIRAYITFLYKLLHGNILCDDLVTLINVNLPNKLFRKFPAFRPVALNSRRSSICRIQCAYNEYSVRLDIFQSSFTLFSNELKTVVA